MTAEKWDDERPWGFFKILEDHPRHKVKRIRVHPGHRLSLQRHQKRSEHWFIIRGEALVTLDEREIPLSAGDAVDIPRRAWHRIRNRGKENLEFIEIQLGDYFGEDDIERREDDYHRV
jgi:mannose-6-phosphate isomerase